MDLFGAADAMEDAGLEHAQQLDLHLGRHLGDFVEEERAARGALEVADLPLHAPVKLPFSWPKSSPSIRLPEWRRN